MPGKVTEWTRNYYDDLRFRIELGDLIECDLTPYKHFCVYVGNGDIVHNSDSAGTVVKEYYKNCKHFGCRARINNGADQESGAWLPFSKDIIVRRALDRIGTGKFDKVENNCEHFANDCRYGVRFSQQVEDARRSGKTKADADEKKGDGKKSTK